MSLLSQIYSKTYIATRGVSKFRSKSVKKVDPGINVRRKVLRLNDAENEPDLDMEDLESDFMNVNKTYKEHVAQMEAGLEKEKFHIVGQKYFKEKSPNFLTWHDKEQIKYLHSTDPEEWTIEKLSEGFPALPEVIKKIVQAKWRINETKIANHDKSVQKNWNGFKTGQIQNLPIDLVQHLNKFTNRALNFTQFVAPQSKTVVQINKKPIGTEFSEIITSYNELKAKNKLKESNEEIIFNVNSKIGTRDNEIVNESNKRKSKPITLQQLQNKLGKKVNEGADLAEDEKLIIRNLKHPQDISLVVEPKENKLYDVTANKYATTSSVALTKKPQDYRHLQYPERIIIPKNLQKKGNTYKLNDCYYDDDGRFLYRVPGMY